MIKLNSEQYYNQEKKHGIYVYVVKDCFLCREYLRELKVNGLNTDDWFLINCSEDEDFYLDMDHHDSMPTTRIYKEGVIMLEKEGVLYETQLKEITEYKL